MFINAMGLGISLACCIAAYLWIAYDWEFDNFHKDEQVANVYKLHSHWENPSPGQNILAPYGLAPLAAGELAGIEQYTRYYFDKGYVSYDKQGIREGIASADSSFFEMFDFPVFTGDLNTFKDEQYTIISRELAKKIFRDEDPVGQTISITLSNEEPIPLIVGAVIENIPHNTSFTFDVMIRMEVRRRISGFSGNDWKPYPTYSTFFKIKDPGNLPVLNEQFQKYLELCEGSLSKFKLEHFKADFTMTEILGAMVNVRMWQKPIKILTGMAILIFLISCFNLANTSFALMARRLKEIGIRKTLGASRSQIFIQFLVEICITVILSLIIGLLIAQHIVPIFSDMWAQGIGNRWDSLIFRLEDVNGLKFFITLLLLVFTGVAIAGFYPALIYSKSRPVKLLKREEEVRGTNIFSRSMLILQFSITLLILISGIIFMENSSFMMNKDMGFDGDQMIYVQFETGEDLQLFSNSIDQLSGVSSTAGSQNHVGVSFNRNEISVDEKKSVSWLYHISEAYFNTMGFRLKEGRRLLASDYGKSVIVTENFVKQFKLDNPIGKTVKWQDKHYSIIGVIDDIVDNWYVVKSLNESPKIFFHAAPRQNDRFLAIKTESNQTDEVYSRVQDTWNKLFPLKPFEGNSQIGHLNNGQLMTANNLKKIFAFLTIMTILLSLAGIYALAALNVEKRTHEIGIRKVLGASVSQLVRLVNREFVLTLLIAGVIGSSACYFLFQNIIDNDFKIIFIEIGWTPYLIASLFLVLVGMITSGSLIYKTATRNPVNTLRNE